MTIIENVQKLAESQAVQTEILGRLEGGLKEVKDHLIGKPAGRPGIITRVDRLEVCDRMKNKVLYLLGGAVVGGIASWLSNKL
jgi:hypothetical protein